MLDDETIIERALANGWVRIVDREESWGGRWTGWERRTDGGSTGYPVGTFPGPKWRNGVKVCDGPYDVTWADAMRDKLDHDDRCQECGMWIEYGFVSVVPPARFCFSCNFWLKRIGVPGFVAETNIGSPGGYRPMFFSVGNRRAPSSSNGFGGSWFTVRFNDGTTVSTCDLWCGGVVPERFADRLPVNAVLESGRLVKA